MASLNPKLVQLAREYYLQFVDTGPRNPLREPVGVVVNGVTLRCYFAFVEYPTLLPQEVYVPLTRLEP